MREGAYRISVHDDPGRIDSAAWDGLLAGDRHANPFVSHAFFDALHASGAATSDTGWSAQFIALWRGEELAAAVPLYAKDHSFGEYVFDWSWAEASERAGLPYYPKWLVAVPFTPVAGTRLLARDAQAREALTRALLELTARSGLSSLHVLFAPPGQIDELARAGLQVRTSVQFHWRNRGFADFEAYLAALTQPKRKKIRAERRRVQEAGIRVERRTGDEVSEAQWRFFARCYEATYAMHGSTPYLNLDFFLRLARSMPRKLVLVLASRGSTPIASALGVFDVARSALYGRYWGALADVPFLHFECCYYQMIEFAIERGLQVFEGGAQGAHKLARGLDPVRTQSAHWLRDPALALAVRRFLAREDASVAATIDELNEHRAFRAASTREGRHK